MPYLPCKVGIAAVSAYLGCFFTYPWAVVAREMVDLWPKEQGGVCTWQGNYRKAMSWLWCNNAFNLLILIDHEFTTNYYPGFYRNYFHA